MNNTLTNDFQSLLLYQKALDYANEKSYEKALLNISKAINIDPKPLYILAKVKILAQSGNFSEAEKTLSLIPSESEEYSEAMAVKKRINKLKKPLNRMMSGFSTGKLINFAAIFFLIVSILSVVLFINEKRKTKVTENLIEIYQKTETISAEVDKLNALLNSKELVEKKDLSFSQSKVIDSLSMEFVKIRKQLNKINSNHSVTIQKLDALDAELKSLNTQDK